MDLHATDFFDKADLRSVLTQARQIFLKYVDAPPKSFSIGIEARPYIRGIKGGVHGTASISVVIPSGKHRPCLGRLARVMAYFMLHAAHPHWGKHRLGRPMKESPVWTGNTFRPERRLRTTAEAQKDKPPKKKPDLHDRYLKAQAQLQAAEERVYAAEKKVARAKRFLAKKQKEVESLEKRLNRPVHAVTPLSKVVLREQLRKARAEA